MAAIFLSPGVGTAGAAAGGGGGSGLPVDESREVPLTATTKEQSTVSDLETFAALLQSAERLEIMLARGDVDDKEYRNLAVLLLRRYDTQLRALQTTGAVRDLDEFLVTVGYSLPRARMLFAVHRVPTVDVGRGVPDGPDGLLCSETSVRLVTANDAVQLKQLEVDKLSPYLREALASIKKHSWLKPDFDGRLKLEYWLRLCDSLGATESITDEQGRQLARDLSNCLSDFQLLLRERSG